jgi:hypothetical protein
MVIIAALLCAAGSAAAQNSATSGAPKPHRPRPLAVVIPQQFAPPQEEYASFPQSAAAAVTAAPSACQLRLAKIAAFQPLPTLVGPGECGATDAVLIDTIVMPDRSKVAVAPPATMRCPMAEAVAQWVREDVAPSLKGQPPLAALDNFDSYSCRGRNNGRADALDVRDFQLADGRELGLTNVNVDKDWRETIRASVCARFSTVLGPGSDGYHEEHIHLDLAERHNNYKVCEWDVRVPPPPPEAQAQAAPPADGPAAQESDAAVIPLDDVPLPRPRPLAQIERALPGHRVTPQ